MHCYRNAKHTCQCNQICTNMSVYCNSVVCTPVCHYAVNIGKCALTCKSRAEPCSRPCRIGTLINRIVNLIRQICCPALCDLKHWANSVNNIKTKHRYRHFSVAPEMAWIAAAAEIFIICSAPVSCFKTILDILFLHLPEWLHYMISILVNTCARSIKCCRTRIDQMDKSIWSYTVWLMSSYSLTRLWTPVCTHIMEARCWTRNQISKKHCNSIACIIFCCKRSRCLWSIPVKCGS